MTAGRLWLWALAAGAVACAASRGHEPPPPPVPSAPPPASAAVPDAAPAPAADAPIGSEHPVLFVRASHSGAWVLYCQARHDGDGDGRIAVALGPHGALVGDVLAAELALAGGRTLAVDGVTASDASGRWLVALVGGKLALIDAKAGAVTELGAGPAPAAFDFASTRLVYVARRAGTENTLVRELSTGRETAIAVPPGSVWRIETEPLGAHAILRQTAPGARRPDTSAPPPCASALPVFAATAPKGVASVVAVAPLAGGIAQLVDGFVVALRAGIVVRQPDGRLVLRDDPAVELSDASCGARVLHADPARNLLLVACAAVTGRPPLELVGPGFRKPLDLDVSFLGHDMPPRASERLVPIYPGAETALVDLERGSVVKLRTGDAIVATSGANALVRRGDRLVIADVDSSIEMLLPGKTAPLAVALATERMAVVAPLVVDTRRARLLGSVAGDPLAIALDGRVLVARGEPADADHLAMGPLEWRQPVTDTGP